MGADSTRHRRYLTAAGGWLAVAFGAVHVVAAPLAHRTEMGRARDDGWWSTFTLDEPTTLDAARRSDAFWRTLGSFGAPVLVFGAHVAWSAHRRQRVPAGLGWAFLAWSVPFVTALPRSPSWTVPAIGALVVAGDRDHRARHEVSDRAEPRGRPCWPRTRRGNPAGSRDWVPTAATPASATAAGRNRRRRPASRDCR